MNEIKILWVDDEIDLLKPHILFLEKKNYAVTTCNNGQDAIDLFKEENFDIIFLDEKYTRSFRLRNACGNEGIQIFNSCNNDY